jgi:transposase
MITKWRNPPIFRRFCLIHGKEEKNKQNGLKVKNNKYYRAFIYPYTNGYLEGINNKIEVIKRMAYGIRNFHQLRNKVLCSLI